MFKRRLIKAIKGVIRRIKGTPNVELLMAADRINALNQQNQIMLGIQYRNLLFNKALLPSFDEVEFRSFSQNGEDGILLYIFSLIGTINKIAVEIGSGAGIECNTANLCINQGWTSLLLEGNPKSIQFGREFYSKHPDTFTYPPKYIQAWISAENINDLISSNGVKGDIDLLSLDVDGNDYWIWKALESVTPRVVILEFHSIWGSDKAVTIPYNPDFMRDDANPDYCSASLAAFVKLGKRKGYRLIGAQRYGFNAFFMRDGIGEDIFPEISPKECLKHPRNGVEAAERLKKVKDLDWVEV